MSVSPREINVAEHREVPWLSVVLGYGPMLPFVAGAIGAWVLTGTWRRDAIVLTVIWATAILAFLAGVRRGLSFRTEGGPAVAQIVTMFCLFVLALASLIALDFASTLWAIVPVLAGFVALMVLDPIAARRGKRRFSLPDCGRLRWGLPLPVWRHFSRTSGRAFSEYLCLLN